MQLGSTVLDVRHVGTSRLNHRANSTQLWLKCAWYWVMRISDHISVHQMDTSGKYRHTYTQWGFRTSSGYQSKKRWSWELINTYFYFASPAPTLCHASTLQAASNLSTRAAVVKGWRARSESLNVYYLIHLARFSHRLLQLFYHAYKGFWASNNPEIMVNESPRTGKWVYRAWSLETKAQAEWQAWKSLIIINSLSGIHNTSSDYLYNQNSEWIPVTFPHTE